MLVREYHKQPIKCTRQAAPETEISICVAVDRRMHRPGGIIIVKPLSVHIYREIARLDLKQRSGQCYHRKPYEAEPLSEAGKIIVVFDKIVERLYKAEFAVSRLEIIHRSFHDHAKSRSDNVRDASHASYLLRKIRKKNEENAERNPQRTPPPAVIEQEIYHERHKQPYQIVSYLRYEKIEDIYAACDARGTPR